MEGDRGAGVGFEGVWSREEGVGESKVVGLWGEETEDGVPGADWGVEVFAGVMKREKGEGAFSP